MVSAEDSLRNFKTNIKTHFYYYTPPPLPSSSPAISRSSARSMRTVRSNIFNSDRTTYVSENLTDSIIDIRLRELASKSSSATNSKALTSAEISDILEVSLDFSACSYSSDISGELRRLANVSDSGSISGSEPGPDTSAGFLHTEIIDSISPEDLQSTVEHSVEGLNSPSMEVKRSAAAKLRLLAKNRADNRALIGESGAIPGLILLLRCSDPISQEHAVTALLNLSLHETNKSLISNAGAIKSLIYVLKTGTEVSKQNAACALLSLALVDENKLTIGACGAISPLVALLINGSTRGKKDALTTLYKLCSVRLNKERAVSAGAVKPLVRLVGEQGSGLAEKAMVVLSSLAAIQKGREAIVEEGGIAVLVEAIEDGSDKGKEFAVLTMSQLCGESVRNRGLLVREGGIPPLVALSQCGTPKAKHKAETLLVYLRESREEASASVS